MKNILNIPIVGIWERKEVESMNGGNAALFKSENLKYLCHQRKTIPCTGHSERKSSVCVYPTQMPERK